MPDRTRYGVFLRPDPATCLAVTTTTGAIRAQYGLVSAGAFPPHATLVGSLPLVVSQDRLIETLEDVLSGASAFPMQNRGVRPLRKAEVAVRSVRRR